MEELVLAGGYLFFDLVRYHREPCEAANAGALSTKESYHHGSQDVRNARDCGNEETIPVEWMRSDDALTNQHQRLHLVKAALDTQMVAVCCCTTFCHTIVSWHCAEKYIFVPEFKQEVSL